MTLEQLVTSRWLFYGLVSKIKESEHLDKRNTELMPASAEVMDSPSAFKSVIWCDKKLEWNIIIKGSHRARRNVLIWPNVWLFILKYWKCFFFSIIFARPTPLRWIPLPRSFSGRKYCVLRLFFPHIAMRQSSSSSSCLGTALTGARCKQCARIVGNMGNLYEKSGKVVRLTIKLQTTTDKSTGVCAAHCTADSMGALAAHSCWRLGRRLCRQGNRCFDNANRCRLSSTLS